MLKTLQGCTKLRLRTKRKTLFRDGDANLSIANSAVEMDHLGDPVVQTAVSEQQEVTLEESSRVTPYDHC